MSETPRTRHHSFCENPRDHATADCLDPMLAGRSQDSPAGLRALLDEIEAAVDVWKRPKVGATSGRGHALAVNGDAAMAMSMVNAALVKARAALTREVAEPSGVSLDAAKEAFLDSVTPMARPEVPGSVENIASWRRDAERRLDDLLSTVPAEGLDVGRLALMRGYPEPEGEADEVYVNLSESESMATAYYKQLEEHLRAHGCTCDFGEVANDPSIVR